LAIFISEAISVSSNLFDKTQPENCLVSLKEKITLSRHEIFEYWINSDYVLERIGAI